MCGNYARTPKPTSWTEGSPPRVRELQQKFTPYIVKKRITPACARITMFQTVWLCSQRDHPRVCGNYRTRLLLSFRRSGSPPRVRELQLICDLAETYHRITPACAGITPSRVRLSRCVGDHPRVCGNYMITLRVIAIALGSPPRVRELLKAEDLANYQPGITPACAGITP